MTEKFESAMSERPGAPASEPPAELLARVAARATASRRTLRREQYLQGILSGDRTILARAITLVESSRDADRLLAEQIVENCLPHTGNSIRVGITGIPGAGKSSLIETLGRYLTEERQEKLAVLAIDPSSQISGGSILGDRTRMSMLAASPQAFIRPSPSRGSFGGVAQRTREAMLLCEAAGFRNIVIETVGVGQSETAVHDMVDFFLLVLIAGAGDELQGIKRGVMELADVVLINKADGDNVTAAGRARSEAEHALHFFPAPASGWTPLALACSAVTGKGVRELWDKILEHSALTRANSSLARNRQDQMRRWMREIIDQGLRLRFDRHPAVRARIAQIEAEVAAGKTTSFHAARLLLDAYSDPQEPSR
ncbi:MAG: methylmalonyl Co-A mutase-associated GTPase MeaB [Chthoniobacter sp.]|nr:methylmalonyl Co-A mutase-associated GTPase MeaB [Chthoniobacter sp.]